MRDVTHYPLVATDCPRLITHHLTLTIQLAMADEKAAEADAREAEAGVHAGQRNFIRRNF